MNLDVVCSVCTGCRACANICPRKCIEISLVNGNYLPRIDLTKCIKCRLCERTCPQHQDELYSSAKCFAAVCDETFRKGSSSGGIATLLIINALGLGMHVFAAKYDAKAQAVVYREVNEDNYNDFRGSMYVDSTLGHAYEDIMQYLKNGESVLFVGLPCHVAAIKSYLRNQRIGQEKLYTVDILCHGSIPTEYFSAHLSEVCSDPCKISKVLMRSDLARYNYSLTLYDDKRIVYSRKRSFSTYIYSFINDLALKESCYSCKYSNVKRIGDISIGDLLGGDRTGVIKSKHTSLVLISSKSGDKMWRDVLANKAGYMQTSIQNIDDVLPFQPSLLGPAKVNPRRSLFLQKYDYVGFSKAVILSCKMQIFISRLQEIRRFIQMIIQKIWND